MSNHDVHLDRDEIPRSSGLAADAVAVAPETVS